MNCSGVHRAIREGRTDQPPVLAHAETCTSCSELLAGGGSLGRAMAELTVTPPVLEAPRFAPAWAAIRAERGLAAWGRGLATPVKGAILGATVLAVLAGVLTWHPRPDLAAYPSERMALVLAVLGVLAGVVAATRIRPLHRPPLSWRWAVVGIAVVLPLWLAGLDEAVTGHMASMSKGPFWSTAVTCFATGSVMGAAIMALFTWFERRSTVPLVIVGLSAAAMGLTGNLAMQLYCPLTDPWHLMVGHASVGAVWATVSVGAAWATRRWRQGA